MKKLLTIIMCFFFICSVNAQIKIKDLPTTTTGISGDFLLKDDAAGIPGSTKKISVGNFLLTYVPSIFLSGTTNYVTKFNSATTIGNSLLFDNGVSVSIGNASPTASTAFEVNSTTGAILIPRLTTTQQNALTKIDGMIWYNSSLPSFMGRAASTDYSFVGTSTSNTATHYTKLITNSTVGDGLLSDDGTNVIVPQNKYISSHTAANSFIGFGASGNELNFDTHGNTGTHGLFMTNTANSLLWDVAGSNECRITQGASGIDIYADNTAELSANNVKISGALQITSGTPGAAKVLTSDGSGNATWQVSS
ncbi:MAG TPA: hypothetical protein PLN38_15790, partial [Chitinophagales bacterium]|nr:hypothetical protein [Chitinophagales bacterium]